MGLLGGTGTTETKEIVQRLAPENLFYLDSSNLQDLRKLLGSVAASANFVLLLSKEVRHATALAVPTWH